MTVYEIIIISSYGRFTFNKLFQYPPIKVDIEKILREEWSKLTIEQQDLSWDLILILEDIPQIPWSGTILSIYGKVHCLKREVMHNDP